MKSKYKYLILSILILILILGLGKCGVNKYNQLKGQYQILSEDYENRKSEVNTIENQRIKERDSLKILLSQRNSQIDSLKDKNYILSNKIVKESKRETIVPKTIMESVEFFNDRYITKENTGSEDKVELVLWTSQEAIKELQERDIYKNVTLLQNEKIINLEDIVIYLENNSNDLNSMLLSSERELQQRKELQELADANIENLQKQLKIIKRKNILNKVLIPTGIIVGGVTGYLIGNK